jgi:hypothetical protein
MMEQTEINWDLLHLMMGQNEISWAICTMILSEPDNRHPPFLPNSNPASTISKNAFENNLFHAH